MPGAGQYRHRIEIQRNHPTLDSSRRKVDDWRLHCVRKARRPRPPRNAQIVVSDANRSEITDLTLIVRSDSLTSQIDSNYQLLYQGKTYKIQSAIDPDGLGNEIELTCKSREFEK
jgi:SPP1 family predicted phage head-tail adaptor